MKVYIYKNHNDANAYGEEIIRVFTNKVEAEAALKADVEKGYGLKWDEIPKEIGIDESDTFKKDYVSINSGDGDTSFWIVEEKEVENASNDINELIPATRSSK